jgi:PAS domain S-box-containing protein
MRPLTDAVLDALREAVVVVDARSQHLPLLFANAAARRCLLGASDPTSVTEFCLYSLLGAATDSVVQAALGTLASGKPSATRVLTWRFPRGEMPISTELKVLPSAAAQRLVMLTFTETAAEPLAEPAILTAIGQLPLDLLILDTELTVTYANAGATRTASNTLGQLLGFSALTLVPTSAVPREAFTDALEGTHYHDDAIAVAMPGAPTRWFTVDVQPLKNDSEVVGLAVLSSEVTERQLRKDASSGSDRLLALTEHARDIISIAGRDGKLQYVSGGVTNALGYTAEERHSNSIFEYVHPEDVDVLRSKYSELAAGRLGTFSHQFRVRHKNGSYRWLDSNYVSALENPLVSGVVVNSRDITERKQAESRLAQREEVFKLAEDAVSGIIFEWDLVRGIVHRSRGVYDVLQIEPKELESAGAWSQRIHPQDSPTYDGRIAVALRSGRGWTTAYRIRDARGRYRSMLERGLVQRDSSGQPTRAIGCVVDVSEIKRLTDLLAETQRTAKMGGWEYNYATCELEWTEEMFRIFETSPEEFVVSWGSMLAQFTPDSRHRLVAAIDSAESADHKLVDLELEIITLENQRLWVRLIGHLETLEGRPFRAFGSVQNVQAQKLAQIALENSTDWLKLSINMANMHAWRWNRATDTLEFAIMEGQVEHSPRVFPGLKKLMTRVHPKDRVTVRRAIDNAFERHTEVDAEFRLRSHDGQYRAYAAVARPLFDAANQPSGLVGVTQDVTARHESEARLRTSEELLRTTTANTADTLLLVDTDLRIRFVNRGLCEMSIDDIVGRDISVLLPERSRANVIAKLRRVLTTAQAATYEFEVAATGAETQYYENRAVLVRDGGVGTGISITVRNITERKRLEQEILDVSSRERQTIGRDLHDGLGQELTGVALMLRGLATRIQKQCPEFLEQVNEIVALVNQSIDTARTLARGLLPVNTDGGGLSVALRALADQSRTLYGLEVDFRAEVLPELTLSETTASHLYRIAQEALTNTARHGRASAVAIFLLVTNNRFSLKITDNGVGIGGASAGSGMGLKIMKYRAGMIGAKLEIAPNYPHGTVVRVTGQQPMVTGALQSAHAI